ncbi:MAG: imidazole glycerol phosphate synthase subunit HisF [Candidatus Omnitrophica bacterium]|nr:imidazole glycerol phosphate synthase subunit HisF [Candidatus Omnitrophota bacterium]
MKNIRVIARLDIKGPNLVKGVHLEGLRVLGKPEYFSKYYYENGADELFYMDIVASLYGRNNLLHIVERTAKHTSIPLTVGGGLRSIDDIKAALRAGADKVCINTAALKNPEFIREAANRFGSSTIMVAIEAIKQLDGTYQAYTDNGREYTGVEVLAWAKQVCELGAGEIMMTSVDREGTGLGFDLDITQKVAQAVPIPVIAHGGPGDLSHFAQVIKEGQADAVTVASMIHYDFIMNNRIDADYSDEGNIEFLKKEREFTKIKKSNIQEIKMSLLKNDIPCRHQLKEEEKERPANV